MKISRKRLVHGSIKPRLESVIRGTPSQYLFHEGHGIKHPLTVYQTSISRIGAAWLKVFPGFDKLRFEVMLGVEPSQLDDLLDDYEQLLYRLNEHIDACHEVLRAYRPPIVNKTPASSAQFLWWSKLPEFKNFTNYVHSQYRETHLGVLVNEMKHNSARLWPISGVTEHNIVLGYFLDGARAGGAIGPNSKLHKKFGHYETAFSFARDMMVHFWWVYQMSELASICIEETLLVDHHVKIKESPSGSEDEKWSEVAFSCAQLSPEFFMDECKKAYPIIICPTDKSFLSLEFPTSRRAREYKSMKIHLQMQMREGSPSFIMPYFQQRHA